MIDGLGEPNPGRPAAVLRAAVEHLANTLLAQPGGRPDSEVALTGLDTSLEPVRGVLAAIAAHNPHGPIAQVLNRLRHARLLLADDDLDGARAAVVTARTIAFRLASDTDLGPDTEDPHRWRC